METSLHRQLKEHYAIDGSQQEVVLGDFRIDVVRGKQLVEIQHGSLAAIRDKIRRLLRRHEVLIVKPIVVRKQLIKFDEKGGRVVEQRQSPKQGKLLDIFDELVYFTRVFPHRNLTLEVLLVDVEEWRHPGHGRRRRWRKNDHEVADQKLLDIHATHRFATTVDLLKLLPHDLPQPFHTGHIAQGLEIRRWIAQRIAYCLRNMGAVRTVGKHRNAHLYEIGKAKRRSA